MKAPILLASLPIFFFQAILRAGGISVQTTDGAKYDNATVAARSALEVTISYADGIATIPFASLTPDSRKALGYDPVAGAAAAAAFQAAQKQYAAAQAIRQTALDASTAKYRAIRTALRERASRMLLLADPEERLRAALAERLLRKRGGKPMPASEFAMLDEDAKFAIINYVPDLMPDELLPAR